MKILCALFLSQVIGRNSETPRQKSHGTRTVLQSFEGIVSTITILILLLCSYFTKVCSFLLSFGAIQTYRLLLLYSFSPMNIILLSLKIELFSYYGILKIKWVLKNNNWLHWRFIMSWLSLKLVQIQETLMETNWTWLLNIALPLLPLQLSVWLLIKNWNNKLKP